MRAAAVQDPDGGEADGVAEGGQDVFDPDLLAVGVAVAHGPTVTRGVRRPARTVVPSGRGESRVARMRGYGAAALVGAPVRAVRSGRPAVAAAGAASSAARARRTGVGPIFVRRFSRGLIPENDRPERPCGCAAAVSLPDGEPVRRGRSGRQVCCNT
nr:hypothetical protein KPHV_77720 [Kitasatospora purpeofusca]